jgi:hypothetical protein
LSRDGSNRASNLVPSCIPCNQDRKKALSIEEFLAHDPKRLAAIKAQLKALLKDAAAVNVTRQALYEALADTGLPVEAGFCRNSPRRFPMMIAPRRNLRRGSAVG